MKITFVSNLFNHHQKYLSDSLYERTNHNYTFVSTLSMTKELKKLGYQQFVDIPYLINAYSNNKIKKLAIKTIQQSDVVLFGSAPTRYVKRYQKQFKPLFIYSERIFKKREIFPKRMFVYFIQKNRISQPKNTYVLCASGYASADFLNIGVQKKHMYCWGYFPENKKYDINVLLAQKDKTKILWVGRLIDWKHPNDVVIVTKMLRESGYSFTIDIVGDGPMMQNLNYLIKKENLSSYIKMLGAIPSDKVRYYMEQAGIYLCTSDKREGWGAVINESMNSGCAVVASHAIGSVPFLLTNNINGMIYHSGNVKDLFQKVKYLLENPSEQNRLGRMAYKTIADKWNADVASERFINLSKHILAGEETPNLYSDGPCSQAPIIEDEWFR